MVSIHKNSVHKLIEKFSGLSSQTDNSTKNHNNNNSASNLHKKQNEIAKNINNLNKKNSSTHTIDNLHSFILTKLKSIKYSNLPKNEEYDTTRYNTNVLTLKQQIDIISKLTQGPTENIRVCRSKTKQKQKIFPNLFYV
jgi:hypothetical protein